VKSEVLHVSQESLYGLLLPYASHPAASIRQYVADAWRRRSDALFAKLLVSLTPDAADSSPSWQYHETVLMALQHHFVAYLSEGKDVELMNRRIFALARTSTSSAIPLVMASLLQISQSEPFEVARMGKQVIPLLLQFRARFGATDDDLFGTLGLTGGHEGAPMTSGQRTLFETVVVPCSWWFLTVRFMTDPTVRPRIAPVVRRASGGQIPSVAQQLIMVSYFLEFCLDADAQCRDLLREDVWMRLLHTSEIQHLHLALDCVVVLKRRGYHLLHLVPIWLEVLGTVMAHQQCILLAMARVSLCTSSDGHGMTRPFRFVYDANCGAPAMMDGGEDTTLGYTWLRAHYPVEVPMSLWTIPCSARAGRDSQTPPSASSARNSVVNAIFRTVYVSSGTEPAVLRECRALMAMLSQQDPDAWGLPVVEAVLERLNSVFPQWETTWPVPKQGIPQAEDYDSWDVDEDENVAGSSNEEEVCEAKAFLDRVASAIGPASKETVVRHVGPKVLQLWL